MKQYQVIRCVDRPWHPVGSPLKRELPHRERIAALGDDANRDGHSVDNRLSSPWLLSCFNVDLNADCHQSGVMSVDHARLQRDIAAVVRRHRESTRLSQEAFADHIGMHRTQYSFVERGKRDIRLSTLERVARGLQKPVWVILREAEEGNGEREMLC